MIFNLQILRALAAIGVVIYHIDYRIVGNVHTDFLGVATFFVLSGFIMCYISQGQSAFTFLIHRFIRIVPLYWICTFARSAILGTDGPALFRSLFFVPSDTPPLLGVGWTLNFEIYFYAIFAAALWLGGRFAPLLAAAALLVVFALHHAFPDVFLTAYYSHSYIEFFLGGVAIFYLWRMTPALPRIVAIPAALLITGCYGAQLVEPGSFMFVSPMLIVGCALFAARAGADCNAPGLVLLGDASYALYLTHSLAMGCVRRLWPAVLDSAHTEFVWFIAMLIGCIVIGIAVHVAVEKPLLTALRAMSPHRPRHKSGQPQRVPSSARSNSPT